MTVAIVAAEERHLPGILAIHNDAVLNSTAIWNEDAVDLDNRCALLIEKRAKNQPYLVAEADGAVLGYASYGDFRPWYGYRHTVEHSVYVHRDHRGRGIASRLMEPLIVAAREQGKHVMVAAIEASNTASIVLHLRFGFTRAGSLAEVGTKFGRWLDLVLMQKML